MPDPQTAAQPLEPPDPQAHLARLAAERYGLAPEALGDAQAMAEADQRAAAAGDTDYLLARIAALQAQQAASAEPDLGWMAPQARLSPADALQRIKAICALFPDLYNAMAAVLATHGSVGREILAMAIKQFRRDTDALSPEDVQGLLTSIVNGGQQGFEAVLRTRKNSAERKSAALPWGKNTD